MDVNIRSNICDTSQTNLNLGIGNPTSSTSTSTTNAVQPQTFSTSNGNLAVSAINNTSKDNIVEKSNKNIDLNSNSNNNNKRSDFKKSLSDRSVVHLKNNACFRDVDRNTPLHIAAKKGDTKTIKELLLTGADMYAKNNIGWTPLFYAAEKGYALIAKLLLAEGAEVDIKNNNGWTSLLCAANNGHALVVELLLVKEADCYAKNSFHFQLRPIDYADQKNHIETLNLLLAHIGN